MDDLILPILALVVFAVIISAIVLPIVALVISIRSRNKLNETIARLETGRIAGGQVADEASLAPGFQQLNARLQRIEVTLAAHSIFPESVSEPTRPGTEISESRQAREARLEKVVTQSTSGPQPSETVLADASPLVPPTVPDRPQPQPISSAAPAPPSHTLSANQIESIIGRRLVGWAAVALILFATAFFLKYAFENRWIGELGRVAIGIALGVGMVAIGYKYQLRRWRIFSQILTAGGVVLLYLSSYAAFGYYHLVTQKVAFVFLAILIAEAAGLALLYNAPAIAIMALVGGFLTPILMHSDRDQYRSLFIYIVALDVGALALLKRWRVLTSVAYFGTQVLFWLWFNENYHPQKRLAVLIFQTAIFLIFLLAHLGKGLIRREVATIEDLALLLINPFVFFATTYELLNPNHHEWMGVFAIGMALLYAAAAKILLARRKQTGTTVGVENPPATNRSELLLMIGIALTFVTIAIPIQLRSNWITIAWAVEALTILWAGLEIRSLRLRVTACALFGLSLAKLFFWDTNFISRPIFTPILNRYFLSSLVVVGCLFAASVLYHRAREQKRIEPPQIPVVILLVAIVTLWFVMSVETATYFSARAADERVAEDAAHLRWLGQMALSMLWAAYAAVLAAAGFVRRSSSVRWAALVLFGLTIIKAMLVDIAQLQQLYRIIVFFVLGVLLLLVAWGYHKAFHFAGVVKMKKFGLLVLIVLAAAAWPAFISVYAQASLSSWPFFVEVTSSPGGPGIYDIVLPMEVLDKAREDLADVRLYDAGSREIPYALRIRREFDDQREIGANVFNRSVVGSSTSEVSVDLGESPGEHNEVEIQTAGTKFRRRVEVEGSDSDKDWRTLETRGVLFSFESQGKAVESSRIVYPTSRYRFLRVRVLRDDVTDDKSPEITGVKVKMSVHAKGELSTWSVFVPPYQLLRNQGAHASVWTIDLGARILCDRLALEVEDPSFSRQFQIEAVDDPQNVRLIARGELTRHIGQEGKPLVVTFDEELYARKLRLMITDFSNPVLTITSIQASAPARQLLFELKEAPTQPLRLFFGNPKITAPHYDFEKELPSKLATEPLHSALGAMVTNPEYVPEPLPLTERIPWLICLVLAASSAALGFILLTLARATLQTRPQQTE